MKKARKSFNKFALAFCRHRQKEVQINTFSSFWVKGLAVVVYKIERKCLWSRIKAIDIHCNCILPLVFTVKCLTEKSKANYCSCSKWCFAYTFSASHYQITRLMMLAFSLIFLGIFTIQAWRTSKSMGQTSNWFYQQQWLSSFNTYIFDSFYERLMKVTNKRVFTNQYNILK